VRACVYVQSCSVPRGGDEVPFAHSVYAHTVSAASGESMANYAMWKVRAWSIQHSRCVVVRVCECEIQTTDTHTETFIQRLSHSLDKLTHTHTQ